MLLLYSHHRFYIHCVCCIAANGRVGEAATTSEYERAATPRDAAQIPPSRIPRPATGEYICDERAPLLVARYIVSPTPLTTTNGRIIDRPISKTGR